jgi:hypothetical protein
MDVKFHGLCRMSFGEHCLRIAQYMTVLFKCIRRCANIPKCKVAR